MQLHYVLSRARRGPPHEPLRTLEELAEEFGLSSRAALVAQMRLSTVPPPKAVFHHHGPFVSAKWYRPSEMRRWWTEHQASKAVREPIPA
jgi:hypothetical protein